MIWPISIPAARLEDGEVSLREYSPADAQGLFEAIHDERVWEHIPREIPRDAGELDAGIRAKLGDLQRLTFTVRSGERVIGTTSIMYDRSAPDGVEIGATQFDPAVWGTGVNGRVKEVLLRELFAHGVQWVQLRTDERNARSAAAIRKLGATDLGVRQDTLIRRDGTTRRSHFFRLDRPVTE
ncbi:GNAT family N-acetyltransferase [Nocardia sp. NPDC020380]|uniref:GNAT family N-acetyltransferase n=1 Tax=Nocardia sp. NPDC020380 TaxID=3364309 RepID=UPI00379755F4